ncbi:MAG: metallophosphoesterase family protein [Anaerolineae bacterium]
MTALYRADFTRVMGDIDLLLGCGDLPYSYMEFIVTQARVRHAYFVHGNHDRPQRLSEQRTLHAPGGWTNVDRRAVYVRELDLVVAGLEGSIRYQPGAPHQYTQRQMRWRAGRLVPQLLLQRALHGSRLDILITHAPPKGIHDQPTGAHQGFSAFRDLVKTYRPRLLLHGHTHRYGREAWLTRYQGTHIVNVHPLCIIDMTEEEISVRHVC